MRSHTAAKHHEAPANTPFAPLPEWTKPLVWTPRGKRPVYRFFAHLLARLLIITPMPAECQVWAAFFPLSLVWSLSPPELAEAGSGAPDEYRGSNPADSPASPSSERPEGPSCNAGKGVGAERIVSLTDPLRPRVTGTVPNIAGRLALTSDSLLFGTAQSRFGGAAVPLGGVRTAALGTLTFIKSAPAVIVDIESESIEPQPIRYQAVFPRAQVETAEIEITDNGALVQRLAAALDTEGLGEVTLPMGTRHLLPLKARLVVNRSKAPEERPSLVSEKLLQAARFDIEPGDTTVLEVGGTPLEIAAFNPVLLERLEADANPLLPTLRWEGPARLSVEADTSNGTGIYSTELTALVPAGTGRVRLFSGPRLLAETGDVVIEAGEPVFGPGRVTAIAPPTAPPAQDGLVVIPADGKTEVLLELKGVRDAGGNIPADGTEVEWSLEGEDGEPVTETSVLQGGEATFRYRAGVEAGDVQVRVVAGAGEFAPVRLFTIRQAPLRLTVTETWPTITAEVASDGGPPADGTPAFWWISRGTITYQATVTNGRTQGTWSDAGIQERPSTPVPRYIPGFVTVGRARGDIRHDRDLEQPTPLGRRIRMSRHQVVVDPIAGVTDQVFESAAVGEVVGGEPNQTVRLILGSTRFPAVEPVAAFAMDSLEGQEAEDVYGGTSATVGPAVSLDTSEARHGPATYRFDGSGGLILEDSPSLSATGNFGFNLWVRFESLVPGQKLLEKAGAYALTLIAGAAGAQLEFTVISGGVTRSVVSQRDLQAGTWYPVAAHVKDERLELLVGVEGVEDRVDLGDTVGAVAVSTAPLEIGSTFVGQLNELAVYDFNQTPSLLFEGGASEIDLTLDDEGRGSFRIVGARTVAAGNEIVVPRPNPFVSRLGNIPVRIYTAPEPGEPNQRPEPFSLDAFAKRLFGQAAGDCAQGIGSGESEDLAGALCDFSAGLLPGVGTLATFRDGFVVLKKFTEGKRGALFYVTGAFAFLGVVAEGLPVARSLVGAYKRVQAVVRGTRAEARAARQLLEKTDRVVLQGSTETESYVARTLADDAADVGAKQALVRLLGTCSLGVATLLPAMGLPGRGVHALHASAVLPILAAVTPFRCISWHGEKLLEEVSGRYADDASRWAFYTALERVFLRGGADNVERALRFMRSVPDLRLSTEAVQGLGVFVRHAPGRERLNKIRQELTQSAFEGLDSARARQVIEELFRNVGTVDARIFQASLQIVDARAADKLVRDWENLIARGAGTSRRFYTTGGFFHHVDQLLKKQIDQLPRIKAIDSGYQGYAGRVDELVEVTINRVTVLLEREFKRVKPGRLLSGDQLSQLQNKIKAAINRAGGIEEINLAQFRQELQIEYVFRGLDREDLRKQVLDEAEKLLNGKLRPFLSQINVLFDGTYPY